MIGEKKLLALPWSENTLPPDNETFDYQVLVKPCTLDKQRYIQICFHHNNNKHAWQRRPSFRIFLSKKQKDFIAETKTGEKGKKTPEDMGLWPSGCCPYISDEDERRLARTFGAKETKNHYMDVLNETLEQWRDDVKIAQSKKQGKIEDEAVTLCPDELPDWLEEQIRRDILPKDHAIIYKKGNVRGLCYVCGQKVHAHAGKRFRQGYIVQCPNCGTKCSCVLEGGQNWKNDYVENIAFAQKGTDGQTVFIRQFHLLRDPLAQWESITPFLQEYGRFAFRGDKAALWLHEGKENWYMSVDRYQLDHWQRSNKLYIYDGSYAIMTLGMREAFQGSKLQYSCWNEYLRQPRQRYYDAPELITYLLHFTRFPVMEFLWKAGYRELVHEKVQGLSNGRTGCSPMRAPAPVWSAPAEPG